MPKNTSRRKNEKTLISQRDFKFAFGKNSCPNLYHELIVVVILGIWLKVEHGANGTYSAILSIKSRYDRSYRPAADSMVGRVSGRR
jgi:hypothetical protein